MNYVDDTQATAGFAPPCVTGLFYNGLAIDLLPSISSKGITFSFRDTALSETSFEVMRREVIDGSTVGEYKSIVLIDSDLSGCAQEFSSMTFSDTEAAKTPGSVWDYAIRTKYATSSLLNIDSDAYTYTVPWFGVVEGVCVAGDTDVAVSNARVCARLKSATTASDDSVGIISSASESALLASHAYVVHSNDARSLSLIHI